MRTKYPLGGARTPTLLQLCHFQSHFARFAVVFGWVYLLLRTPLCFHSDCNVVMFLFKFSLILLNSTMQTMFFYLFHKIRPERQVNPTKHYCKPSKVGLKITHNGSKVGARRQVGILYTTHYVPQFSTQMAEILFLSFWEGFRVMTMPTVTTTTKTLASTVFNLDG